ncbi:MULTISPECIES: hypothetical protein [Mycobacterium]|uniref:PE domain-containing protein n=1 Tax=Mycobacterium paraffinicum TaxID=53378 RepID=A0ABP8RM46_9MYCO|nr:MULTISPECIES: hypothetical protein [Mycobacterium]MCV7310459.1 hypothetical protein [Mycobacterium paraffinicum]
MINDAFGVGVAAAAAVLKHAASTAVPAAALKHRAAAATNASVRLEVHRMAT